MRSFFLLAVFLLLPGLAWPAEDDDPPEETEISAAAEPDEGVKKLTAEDIPAPILRAEVGDWALYRTAKGGTVRITVGEKWDYGNDITLVLRIATTTKKKKRPRETLETIDVRENVAELRSLGPEDYVVSGEYLARNRKVPAVIVNYVENGKVVRQAYFSDDIPVHGLLRGVTITGNKRENTLSLNDFGYAEQED